MRLKLDENLGHRAAELIRSAGHDVTTVPIERLCLAPDQELINTCRREHRCLVTLDVEFANPLVFRPSEYFGIAVVRLPPKPAPDHLTEALHTLLQGLLQAPIEGRLWIVQRRRIREYQDPDREVF